MVVRLLRSRPAHLRPPGGGVPPWLFEREGFTIWNGHWYAGHHTPGYSILFPPLAALLGGPEVVGALSTIASAAIFGEIVRRHFGPTARWGALWFGFAAGTLLFSSRLPWGLGATFALAAVLALQRGRPWVAAALGICATLSSPVAGAFLAMGAAAYALAGHRRDGVLLAASGLVPPLLLTTAFPEGGSTRSSSRRSGSFRWSRWPRIPFFAPRERWLQIACVLYTLVAIGAVAVDTPFGGNTVRMGQLIGGPLVLCAVLAPAAARAARGSVRPCS